MVNPTTGFTDAETGEYVERPMTDAEYAEHQKIKAEAAARAAGTFVK